MITSLLVYCSLLNVVCVAKPNDVYVSDKMVARLEDQEKRLNKLVTRYVNLEKQLADNLKLTKEANRQAQTLLNTYINNKIDGVWRKSDMFKCGHTYQIINYMAVCDGKPDCDNGYDEGEDFCINPLPVGSHWQGWPVYNYCGDAVENYTNLTVTIEKSYRPHWFNAYVQIRARGVLEVDMKTGTFDMSLPLYGAYSLGSHILFLHSRRLTHRRIVLTGHFDGVNYDRCSGFYVHEASMKACAEYRFYRVS